MSNRRSSALRFAHASAPQPGCGKDATVRKPLS